MFSSQEIGSSLVSFLMIFEAQQPELFRFIFRALSSKFPKIQEFNLTIGCHTSYEIDLERDHGHPYFKIITESRAPVIVLIFTIIFYYFT